MKFDKWFNKFFQVVDTKLAGGITFCLRRNRMSFDEEPIDTGGNYDEDDVIETNGIADCMSPELPGDGDRWLMGWSEDEETIYMEYFGSGIWLPWYSGELEFDQLTFSWIDEFGFVVPPEEEED